MHPVWQKTLEAAKHEYGAQIVATWFDPIRVVELSENDRRAKLEFPNTWFKDFFRSHYSSFLASHLPGGQYEPYRIDWLEREEPGDDVEDELDEVDVETASMHAAAALLRERADKAARAAHLQEGYDFENFIVGPANRFAYEACVAVAEEPGRKQFNPLFLYGGTGLGKTHLVTAVGREILRRDPNRKVVYMSGESFTNIVVDGIRRNAMREIRKTFDGVSALIVDDIHFIAGKEATQEEFFHRFNDLYSRGCHIILTSDRKPQDIPKLEERLRSRFVGGFIDEVRLPDWETRVAILSKKAEKAEAQLPDEVAHLIANSVTTNIRELEGALNRVLARASFNHGEVTLDEAKDVLASTIDAHTAAPTVEEIQKAVAKHFSLRVADLKGPRRTKTIVEPRQIAMYLVRDLTSCSFPEIGSHFGGRDHSTVIHSIDKVRERISGNDPRFVFPVEVLMKGFNGAS